MKLWKQITIIFFLLILLSSIYTCSKKIEQSLDQESRLILENSENEVEITKKIIKWENNLELSTFKYYERGLRKSNDAKWFIFIRKANCGERAIIFEDMAKRTNLTYRRVGIDGFIDPQKSNVNNHRWTEVWLDDDWRIADSGFNLSYPEKNQSYFTSVRGYLFGNVAVLNFNRTYEDCTDSYVDNTSKLTIQAVKDGNDIKNAEISINLIFNNLSCPVVGGNFIKLTTNDSGFQELKLGNYNDTYYMVNVHYEDRFYKYFGQENITLKNETETLVVQLNKRKIKLMTWFYIFFYTCISVITYIIIKRIGIFQQHRN